ncbi:hypothetical protein NMG60_11005052 [Bertholletia excelsa]
MVCLGLIFGCQNSSAESYIISALAIIGIVVGLRLLCFTLFHLLNRPESQSEPSSDDDDDIGDVEIHPPRNQEHTRECRVPLPDSKFVILAGESRASFIAQPAPFPAN